MTSQGGRGWSQIVYRTNYQKVGGGGELVIECAVQIS